ncbi:MAG: hypothetical protein ACI93R_000846 [Flavobacteriales bacterium]|jgi:hypothetical protein
MKTKHIFTLTLSLITSCLHLSAFAHGPHTGGIQAEKNKQTQRTFDIVHAKVSRESNVLTFHMGVNGKAGAAKPKSTGALAGSDIFSYVWPTNLNSSTVGFEEDAGILALAVTSHPDFDDTPLYDENKDRNPLNDGKTWHSHWVVLAPNEGCDNGALAVIDIPEGSKPKVPATWPGLPILLDSPGWDPIFNKDSVEVKVAFNVDINLDSFQYDGVTAGLRVHQNVHAPLLCVVNVFDIASGDLSLPGKIEP